MRKHPASDDQWPAYGSRRCRLLPPFGGCYGAATVLLAELLAPQSGDDDYIVTGAACSLKMIASLERYSMPLYTVTTQAGVLSEEAKRGLAAQLTKLHSEYAGVPPNWVHIVFQDYSAGSGFTAGKPSVPVALTLLIRTGRSAEYKRDLLKRLWTLLQTATDAPDDEIVIGIQEVPPSQAMEMAQVMPDVAS